MAKNNTAIIAILAVAGVLTMSCCCCSSILMFRGTDKEDKELSEPPTATVKTEATSKNTTEATSEITTEATTEVETITTEAATEDIGTPEINLVSVKLEKALNSPVPLVVAGDTDILIITYHVTNTTTKPLEIKQSFMTEAKQNGLSLPWLSWVDEKALDIPLEVGAESDFSDIYMPYDNQTKVEINVFDGHMDNIYISTYETLE